MTAHTSSVSVRWLFCGVLACVLWCLPASAFPGPASGDPTLMAVVIPADPSMASANPGQWQQIAILPPGRQPAPVPGHPKRQHGVVDQPIKMLVVTGLLLVPLDDKVMPEIQHETAGAQDSSAVNWTSNLGTPLVLVPALGTLYLTGDSYDKGSAKLAAAALLDVGVLVGVGKTLTGRLRPYATGDEMGEFEGPHLDSKNASFPSGHTAAAFAVATVLAHRYPKQRWIYYGLASAVGLSRILKSEHFPSDVLVGAGTGMYAGECALRADGRLLSFSW